MSEENHNVLRYAYDAKARSPVTTDGPVRISEEEMSKAFTTGDYTISEARRKHLEERSRILESRPRRFQSDVIDDTVPVILESRDYISHKEATKIRERREEIRESVREEILAKYKKAFAFYKKAKRILETKDEAWQETHEQEWLKANEIYEKGPPISKEDLEKEIRETLVRRING